MVGCVGSCRIYSAILFFDGLVKVEEPGHEAHVPAESEKESQDTRLPQPHEDRWGAAGDLVTSPAGAQAAGRLSAVPLARGRCTRLTDSPEFERAYRRGLAFRGRLFAVHAYPNGLGCSRLGLSVSKKVGNAVTRNTVRRRLKEVFYAAQPEIGRDLDLVVSARPASASASFDELSAEFARALCRLDDDGSKAGS